MLHIRRLLWAINFFTVVCQITEPGTAPQQVKAKAVSRTTALVQWNAPAQPNGDIVVSASYSSPCLVNVTTCSTQSATPIIVGLYVVMAFVRGCFGRLRSPVSAGLIPNKGQWLFDV